jgi:hypothetical protein
MAATFNCQACGKSYNWKPELAGKKAKCKCGAMITVPQSLKADEPDLDSMYDLVEDDAPKPKQRVAPIAPIAAAGAGGVATAPAQQTGMRCPSCGSGMQPGAMLCVTCGFNLKTGKKMGTAFGGAGAPPAIARPAPGTMPGGAPFGNVPPSLGPKRVQQASYDNDGNQKKVLILGIVAVLVIAGLVGGFVMLKQGDGGEAEAAMKFEDKEITAKLKEDANTEVKAFLDNKMFSLLGMTTSQATQWADNLYKLGAKDVRAFDGRVSMSVIVELPADAAQRQAIIDHYNRYHQDNPGVPKATDEGQRYLWYRLKIANV